MKKILISGGNGDFAKEIKKHNCAQAKKPPLKIANHTRGILGKKL